MKSTKLAACIKLAHKVTVYVPGTVGAAAAGDTSEWIARAASKRPPHDKNSPALQSGQ